MVAFEMNSHVEDVARLLVNHRLGQAKTRNLRPHEATGLGFTIKDRDVIPQRCQITRHGKRSRPGTNARDALAVFWRYFGHARGNVRLHVGSDAFQSANRDRLWHRVVCLFHTAAAAGWLAGSITGATQNTRKHVGHPIDHVGIAVATLANQTDVFGNGSVGWASPLAIDDFVEVRRIGYVGRLQKWAPIFLFSPSTMPQFSIAVRTVKNSLASLRSAYPRVNPAGCRFQVTRSGPMPRRRRPLPPVPVPAQSVLLRQRWGTHRWTLDAGSKCQNLRHPCEYHRGQIARHGH